MTSSNCFYTPKDSSHDLMCYLSRKLMSKSKEINLLYHNLSSQISVNPALLNTLKEVDIQLKQASFAIKALLSENENLKAQIYNSQKKKTISTTSSHSRGNNKKTKSHRVSPSYHNLLYKERPIDMREDNDYSYKHLCSNQKFHIPLRVRMASKNKDSTNKNKCASSYSYENGCGSSNYTSYDSPKGELDECRCCSRKGRINVLNKSRKSNSNTKMTSLYRTFEQSTRKFSDE